MVRYSFLVRLSHPLLHAGLSGAFLNHPIRPPQHVGRNRETDLLGRLEVNHKLKFRRLLDRKVVEENHFGRIPRGNPR